MWGKDNGCLGWGLLGVCQGSRVLESQQYHILGRWAPVGIGREALVRWNQRCSREMPYAPPPPRGGRWKSDDHGPDGSSKRLSGERGGGGGPTSEGIGSRPPSHVSLTPPGLMVLIHIVSRRWRVRTVTLLAAGRRCHTSGKSSCGLHGASCTLLKRLGAQGADPDRRRDIGTVKFSRLGTERDYCAR